MKNFNQSQIEESIKLEINGRLMNYKNKVLLSTGSFHDKDDVCKLLDEVLAPEFIAAFVMNTLNINYPEGSNENLYSLSMIKSAMNNLDFSNYVNIQKDTAEFDFVYNNRIELSDVEFEIDESTIIDDIEIELSELIINQSQLNEN